MDFIERRKIVENKKNRSSEPIPLIVNRKQERVAEKALNKKGKSKDELNSMIEILNIVNGSKNTENHPKLKECLFEGDKVKLNVAKIKSHPSWEGYDKEYKAFVENHDGIVFTVEYDKNKTDRPNLICLKEDTSRQRWMFWDGDLYVLDERDGKFKEMYLIEEG